ncbi:MAG: hypothetical protein ACK4N5_17505 [Myxococcales bacterium]
MDLASDPLHCGGCGNVCGDEGTERRCVSGSCEFAGCRSGYRDCDGNVANGCESKRTCLPNQNCDLTGCTGFGSGTVAFTGQIAPRFTRVLTPCEGLRCAVEAPHFGPGSRVVLHQSRGIPGSQGAWELATVKALHGTQPPYELELEAPLARQYAGGAQVAEVLQFGSVEVAAGQTVSLHPSQFLGTITGGVLALEVSGDLVVRNNGRISLDGAGFIGGRSTTTCDTGDPGDGNDSGGSGGTGVCSGGGGGANAFEGGTGTVDEVGCRAAAGSGGTANVIGTGAAALGFAPAGGGGGQSGGCNSACGGQGGRGGGVVLLFARRIVVDPGGRISANGTSASPTSSSRGGGGGGAGGSVVLVAREIVLAGSEALPAVTVSGGTGASCQDRGSTAAAAGGDGGAGLIVLRADTIDGSLSGTFGRVTAMCRVADLLATSVQDRCP